MVSYVCHPEILRVFLSLQGSKTGGSGKSRANVTPPSQGKGSLWETANSQSWSPSRLKAPRQPRPGPAPGQARGSREGLGLTVPSGSVPRARGRGRGLTTSPLHVTNGLGAQAHATFQPRAGLKRADTPHSTPAKAGQGEGGQGAAPNDPRDTHMHPISAALSQT